MTDDAPVFTPTAGNFTNVASALEALRALAPGTVLKVDCTADQPDGLGTVSGEIAAGTLASVLSQLPVDAAIVLTWSVA